MSKIKDEHADELYVVYPGSPCTVVYPTGKMVETTTKVRSEFAAPAKSQTPKGKLVFAKDGYLIIVKADLVGRRPKDQKQHPPRIDRETGQAVWPGLDQRQPGC